MICNIPARAAQPAKYPGPCDAQSPATVYKRKVRIKCIRYEHKTNIIIHTQEPTNNAQAPLADEQIPALPPNKAAKKPKTTVVHRPTSGLTPATTVYVCNNVGRIYMRYET